MMFSVSRKHTIPQQFLKFHNFFTISFKFLKKVFGSLKICVLPEKSEAGKTKKEAVPKQASFLKL